MKPSRTIPIAIVVGGIIIASAIYISVPHNAPVATPTVNPTLVRPVSASDHIFGDPSAPVMIIEYCDFDSEYCRLFHDVLHQIIANQGASGKVAWVYREFPLTEIHPDSLALARAAECAATSAGASAVPSDDAFWRFASALFDVQPADPSALSPVAATAGLSGAAFAACYASVPKSLDDRIAADRQNALDMGATGTPFSIIVAQGKTPVVMDGAYSYDAVEQLVSQALRK
ncbi:MAG: hypothetical protein RLZZ26_265 [Candidatus Parcubacteria bacterium]|jgi:protein-disulfide isomerase